MISVNVIDVNSISVNVIDVNSISVNVIDVNSISVNVIDVNSISVNVIGFVSIKVVVTSGMHNNNISLLKIHFYTIHRAIEGGGYSRVNPGMHNIYHF